MLGARLPHRSAAAGRGGNIRRRVAPLSNPRPAQPAPPAILPIARRNELEPSRQPAAAAPSLGRARCSQLPCGRACGVWRAHPLQHGQTAGARRSAAGGAARPAVPGCSTTHSHSRRRSTRCERQGGQRRDAPSSAAQREATRSHVPPGGARTRTPRVATGAGTGAAAGRADARAAAPLGHHAGRRRMARRDGAARWSGARHRSRPRTAAGAVPPDATHRTTTSGGSRWRGARRLPAAQRAGDAGGGAARRDAARKPGARAASRQERTHPRPDARHITIAADIAVETAT